MLNDAVQQLAKSKSPLLGMVKTHVQFEGNQSTILRHDDSIGRYPLSPVTADIKFEALKLKDYDNAHYANCIDHIAEQFARGFSGVAYKTLDKDISAAGNKLDAGGKPFDENMLLEMYNKLDHTFDGEGNWQPQVLLTGQKLFDQIAGKVPSEDFKKKLEKILQKKRDEFNLREADRKLVG